MSNYYSTSEYAAGTSLLTKMVPFAVLGILLNELDRSIRGPRGRMVLPIGAALIVTTAVAIEVSHLFLAPYVADASDVAVYLSGTLAGYSLCRIFHGTRNRPRTGGERVQAY